MRTIYLSIALLSMYMGSSAALANIIENSTIYVSNCNECYQLCNNKRVDAEVMSNCVCGSMSSLTATFSTTLTLSENCNNSTCDVTDLTNTMQKSMNTCTFTATTSTTTSTPTATENTQSPPSDANNDHKKDLYSE